MKNTSNNNNNNNNNNKFSLTREESEAIYNADLECEMLDNNNDKYKTKNSENIKKINNLKSLSINL